MFRKLLFYISRMFYILCFIYIVFNTENIKGVQCLDHQFQIGCPQEGTSRRHVAISHTTNTYIQARTFILTYLTMLLLSFCLYTHCALVKMDPMFLISVINYILFYFLAKSMREFPFFSFKKVSEIKDSIFKHTYQLLIQETSTKISGTSIFHKKTCSLNYVMQI